MVENSGKIKFRENISFSRRNISRVLAGFFLSFCLFVPWLETMKTKHILANEMQDNPPFLSHK
jgi:hypothetical protein